jgi:NADPH:quinone reductase-like Zn-dependent oxidoreductase
MKALITNRYGTISDLKVSEINKPIFKDNEVLVKIKSSSINPADLMVITGKNGGKFLHANNFPFAIGFDYSGVIEEVGKNVSTMQKNDEVFGFLDYSKKNRQGSFAEYVAVKPETLAKKPENISFPVAASATTAASAALQGLKDKGNLQSGQRVFINGASGGVGSYAVRIAKNLGAEVWATCSSRNFEYVKSLGADQVIDYKTVNLKKLSEKFDVFLDVAARTSFGEINSLLSSNGTYVSLLPMSPIFLWGKLRSFLSSKNCRGVIVKPKNSDLSLLSKWMTEDKLNISVDTSFSLTDAINALQKFESGGINGKIAVLIEG